MLEEILVLFPCFLLEITNVMLSLVGSYRNLLMMMNWSILESESEPTSFSSSELARHFSFPIPTI